MAISKQNCLLNGEFYGGPFPRRGAATLVMVFRTLGVDDDKLFIARFGLLEFDFLVDHARLIIVGVGVLMIMASSSIEKSTQERSSTSAVLRAVQVSSCALIFAYELTERKGEWRSLSGEGTGCPQRCVNHLAIRS